MASPVFGDLRGTLAHTPGALCWARLCDLLERAMDHAPIETAQQWLPYAHDQLSHWPDELRVAPARWQERTAWHAFMPLARSTHAYQTQLVHKDAMYNAPISRLALHQSPLLSHQFWRIPADIASQRHVTHLTLDQLDSCTVTQMAPHLDRVTSLTLRQPAALNITPDSSALTSQALPALRHIRLVVDHWSMKRRAAFLAAPWVGRLRSLSLEQMSGAGFYSEPEDLINAIAMAAPELEHLGVPGLYMYRDARKALSRLERLSTLTLKSPVSTHNAQVTYKVNEAGELGAPLSWSAEADLRTLGRRDLSALHTLAVHAISKEQLLGLLTLIAGSPLDHLSLSFSDALHHQDAQALAQSPVIARLKRLHIQCKLPVTAIMQERLLGAISTITPLTHITIKHTNTSSDIINQCMEAFDPQNLLHLGLDDVPCEHPGRLFDQVEYPLLQHLDLRGFCSHKRQDTDSDYALSIVDLIKTLSTTTSFPRVETLSLPEDALVHREALLDLIQCSSMGSLRHITS